MLKKPKVCEEFDKSPVGLSFAGSVILVFVSSFKIEKNK